MVSDKIQNTVYIGTCSTAETGGIEVYRFDEETGKLHFIENAQNSSGTVFITISYDRKYLYGVSNQGSKAYIMSYNIMEDGTLSYISTSPMPGSGLAYIDTDSDNKFIVGAFYTSNSMFSAEISRDGSPGKIISLIQCIGGGPNKLRQEASHPHSIKFDSLCKNVVSADLGADKLWLFDITAGGGLVPWECTFQHLPAGEGPRYIAFHPGGKWMYLVTELGNKVFVYEYDAAARKLTERQKVSTTPCQESLVSESGDIRISADGKYLYVSVRGSNIITVFKIDENDGTLSLIGHTPCGGERPNSFVFSKSGSWLLVGNLFSGSVAAKRLDGEKGFVSDKVVYNSIKSPMCVRV